VKEVVAMPDVSEKLIAQGATPRGSTPAELQKVIDADKDRYARVIKARNVRVD
jgi:tripartite-type tricarboxylate transporter receptor subunit TctC